MASNPFEGRNPIPVGARDIVPVVAGVPFGFTAVGLYIAVAGDVSIKTETGATRVVPVQAGMILPVGCTSVNSAGTTATGIFALLVS